MAENGSVNRTINEWRKEFPVIEQEGRLHFNNCSVGAIPHRVLEARRECERVWVEEGNPWPLWMEKVNQAKSQFADLINADPDEIAVLSNATQAFAQIASAIDYEGPNEIITTDLEFPTLPQFWQAQRKRGARVRFAESPDGIRVPVEQYIDQMRESTLMVCTAHAFSFTGGLTDIEAISEAIHDIGGYFFLDAYQTAGAVPIDVKSQKIDMLTSGTVKFLLGPAGISFLYVDGDIVDDLQPFNMGWFSADNIFSGEIRNPQFADGARRFELGSPPIQNAYSASAGLSVIQEAGVDRIRQRIVRLTDRLIRGVESQGYQVRTPERDEHRGAVVNVQVADESEVVETLVERGFNLMARGGGVRISPHFFNTIEEVDRLIQSISDVAEPV